jgi:DNA-binding NtrC family response regulator
MPEALIESELILGFEEAVGGAVFLNEIDALSIASQAKILGLLRDKGCESRETKKKQNETVRIMAAAGEDLSFRVREGAFREDLYIPPKCISNPSSASQGEEG